MMKLKIALLVILLSASVVSVLFADTQGPVIRISPVWESADTPPSDKWEKFTQPTRTGGIEELWVSKGNAASFVASKEDIADASVKMPSQKEVAELNKFIPEIMKAALKPKPQLFISLKDSRKEDLARLTRENKGKRLAFFVNGKFVSAPRVMEPIEDGSMVIAGEFLLIRINLVNNSHAMLKIR